jgi:hypothetical protein
MYLITVFIVMALFNTVAFLAPFNREGNGFWTGYAFAMIAMVASAAVGLYAVGRTGMRSKFYGVPLVYVATTYLAIQILLSFVQMAVPPIPLWISVIVNALLLGVFLIGVVSVGVATGEIGRLDAAVKAKTFFIKSLQADIEGLAARAADDASKKSLKDLAEVIRYSDPMSSPQLAALENTIESKAAALAESLGSAKAVEANCTELQQLFIGRNKKCKLLK